MTLSLLRMELLWGTGLRWPWTSLKHPKGQVEPGHPRRFLHSCGLRLYLQVHACVLACLYLFLCMSSHLCSMPVHTASESACSLTSTGACHCRCPSTRTCGFLFLHLPLAPCSSLGPWLCMFLRCLCVQGQGDMLMHRGGVSCTDGATLGSLSVCMRISACVQRCREAGETGEEVSLTDCAGACPYCHPPPL